MSSTSTATQNSTSTKSPYAPAIGPINSILGNVGAMATNTGLTGNETGAINSLVALARAGNPYAPAIDSYATTMLSGGGPDRTGLVSDAYASYQKNLAGTAAGDNLD